MGCLNACTDGSRRCSRRSVDFLPNSLPASGDLSGPSVTVGRLKPRNWHQEHGTAQPPKPAVAGSSPGAITLSGRTVGWSGFSAGAETIVDVSDVYGSACFERSLVVAKVCSQPTLMSIAPTSRIAIAISDPISRIASVSRGVDGCSRI